MLAAQPAAPGRPSRKMVAAVTPDPWLDDVDLDGSGPIEEDTDDAPEPWDCDGLYPDDAEEGDDDEGEED